MRTFSTPGRALGHAGSVHGGVSGAHDHDVGAKRGEVLAVLGGTQELKDVMLLAVLEAHVARRPGAHADHDVRVALGLELIDALDLASQLDLCAKGQAELLVGVDVVVGDAKLRDDVARHAARGGSCAR